MEHGQNSTVFIDWVNNMSSDSSDDENLDLLREAVDHEFLNESMFMEKPRKSLNSAIFPSAQMGCQSETNA